MALIYEPKVFAKCDRVRAALSLRGTTRLPFGFNMSLSVGDAPAVVSANRARMARRLGFEPSRIATQRQVHGDNVVVVDNAHEPVESDAIITDRAGWLLAVSVADCIPVLLFDTRQHVVAAVHSGWRGTRLNIVGATIARMQSDFGTDSLDVLCYVGASASQCCYEVGEEVAAEFPARCSRPIDGGKYLFDNKGRVLEQLISCGLQPNSIELDMRCSMCDLSFHSFRRDGKHSGRMFAAIGMTTSRAEGDALGTA